MTGNGMASLRMAMAWQIIEGFAQLRHGSECKEREEPSIAMQYFAAATNREATNRNRKRSG